MGAMTRYQQSSTMFFRGSKAVRRKNSAAFSLTELIVVAAITSLLLVIVAPALTHLKSGSDFTSATYTMMTALETARSYAVANNTYTWLGAFEDDPTSTTATKPAAAGVGRTILSIVASSDGSRIYTFTSSTSNINSSAPLPLDSSTWGTGRLIQVSKLLKIEGVHLATDIDSLKLPGLTAGSIKSAYQLGHNDFSKHPVPSSGSMVTNPTTISYPIGNTSPDYTFNKIIEFNPRGEAMKIVSDYEGAIPTLAVGLQPARGNVVDTKSTNVSAITISALTGATKLFRQ